MLKQQELQHKDNGPIVPYLLCLLLYFVICGAWFAYIHPARIDFWDARTYAEALQRVANGASPYDTAQPKFVYPPIFLKVAAPLSHVFRGRVGWSLYIAALCVGIGSLPWILTTYYIHGKWLTPAAGMLLFTFQPRLFGEIALLTGNFGVLLHILIFASGVLGIRHKQWLPFYAAVVLAGLVKPPFLALLLLPLLAGRRQAWQSLCAVAVVAGGYLAQKLLVPGAFGDFQASVNRKIIEQEDSGLGIYSYLQKLGHIVHLLKGTGALLAHVGIIAAMAVALFLLRRAAQRPAVAHLWLPAIIVLAILANPRLEAYEATMGMLPAMFICADSVMKCPAHRFRPVVLCGVLSAFVALVSKDGMAANCVLLLAAVVLSLARFYRARNENSARNEFADNLTLSA